jgi:transposase
MVKHPQWALKHKKKRTELRLIKGHYYLYKITSKWDPEKKRSKKITLGILGKITKEEGFVESEKHKLKRQTFIPENIYLKEAGLSSLITEDFSDYIDLIKKHFPKHWKFIIALAYSRFAFQSPLKNAQYYFSKSYLSEIYKNVGLSSRSISLKLKEVGINRKEILSFFDEFKIENDNILFDGTDMLSNSQNMGYPQKSKTKKGTFKNIINLMFIFSTKTQLPLYYRIMSGKTKDISAFKLCLDEAKIDDAIVIADKGFYSESNIKKLEDERLKYIVPLRRNSKLIDYKQQRTNNLIDFDGYFMYEKKIIWYNQKIDDGKRIITYRNDNLRAEEINDYLRRCETLPEKYNKNTFFEKQHGFGTISFITNLDEKVSAENIYLSYKSRNQIESMIGVFKNIMDADKSYMQDEDALEGWMFINYIAMHWYYKLILKLKEKELNAKFSPKDIILFLKDVKKLKINDKWLNIEITKKNLELFNKLNLHIT